MIQATFLILLGSLTTTQSTTFSWSAGTDVGGTLAYYELSIGTTPGGTDILSWSNIGLVTSYQATGLPLADGLTYYPSLRSHQSAQHKTDALLSLAYTFTPRNCRTHNSYCSSSYKSGSRGILHENSGQLSLAIFGQTPGICFHRQWL